MLQTEETRPRARAPTGIFPFRGTRPPHTPKSGHRSGVTDVVVEALCSSDPIGPISSRRGAVSLEGGGGGLRCWYRALGHRPHHGWHSPGLPSLPWTGCRSLETATPACRTDALLGARLRRHAAGRSLLRNPLVDREMVQPVGRTLVAGLVLFGPSRRTDRSAAIRPQDIALDRPGNAQRPGPGHRGTPGIAIFVVCSPLRVRLVAETAGTRWHRRAAPRHERIRTH